MATNEQAAFTLWKQLLDAGAYSPWQNDDYGRTYCAFCYEEHPDHHEACIYVKACRLVDLEPNARVGY